VCSYCITASTFLNGIVPAKCIHHDDHYFYRENVDKENLNDCVTKNITCKVSTFWITIHCIMGLLLSIVNSLLSIDSFYTSWTDQCACNKLNS